jgi:hypothetical protein
VDELFANYKYIGEEGLDIYALLQEHFVNNRKKIRDHFVDSSTKQKLSCERYLQLDRKAVQRSKQIRMYLENRFSTNRRSIYNFTLDVMLQNHPVENFYVAEYLRGLKKIVPNQGMNLFLIV